MPGKIHYANGREVGVLDGTSLKCYYESGALKAEGRYESGMMQGAWRVLP